MALTLQLVQRDRIERIIALARVTLAATSLLAIYLDPAEPQRHISLTYGLHAAYVIYSLILAAVMWRRDSGGRWLVATHLVDIVAGSVFQYLTLGPSSPFFMYFTFALASAAVRWGSRGTLRTAGLVIGTYVVMGLSLSRALGPGEFELNRFIIRIAYLAMVAAVLVYLGRHEEQLRAEMTMLARWPALDIRQLDRAIADVLAHAAGIVQAPRALVLWSRDDEPWIYIGTHPPGPAGIERHAPDAFDPAVSPEIAGGPFCCDGPIDTATAVTTSREGRVVAWTGRPMHAGLLPRVTGRALGAAPFRTEQVSGWVFFPNLAVSSAESLPLLEVLGREVGASLDQAVAWERGRELAVREDRTSRARDLHDGILQSLTGVRLELQALATGREPADGERLLVLERALAQEQRELRRVIEPQRRQSSAPLAGTLASRLDDLGRRMATEWRAPISIRVVPPGLAVPGPVTDAAALLVHEAIVNALKHAHPSRVAVDVTATDGALRISVADDGRGFPFHGRRSHEDLAASGTGPVSLRERVASLGGHLSLVSSPAGSRVELTLPLEARRAG